MCVVWCVTVYLSLLHNLTNPLNRGSSGHTQFMRHIFQNSLDRNIHCTLLLSIFESTIFCLQFVSSSGVSCRPTPIYEREMAQEGGIEGGGGRGRGRGREGEMDQGG